jgi:ferredoxin
MNTQVIDKIIEKCGKTSEATIPILQGVQGEFGYLPTEAMQYIAKNTEISATQIYGVATFYKQFKLNPVGKYIVIGVLYTTLKISPDKPLKQISCAHCKKCVQACPQKAISANHHIHPLKCISYHTIASKNTLSIQDINKFQCWVYGCDLCQEVCPHNEYSPLTTWPEFLPSSGVGFAYFDQAFSSKTLPPIPKSSPIYRYQKHLKTRFSSNW